MLDNHTEELLAIHEHQVEVMKNYYEENKVIFKLVEKRETLFRTMEEFEVQHGFITKKKIQRLNFLGGQWLSVLEALLRCWLVKCCFNFLILLTVSWNECHHFRVGSWRVFSILITWLLTIPGKSSWKMLC